MTDISHFSDDNPDRWRTDTLHGCCPGCGFALVAGVVGDLYCPDCGKARWLAIEIIKRPRLVEAATSLPITPMVAILFGGDRLACADWGVLARVEDTVVGLASVADRGEMNSGTPTLIGVLVLPGWRRLGIGSALLRAVVAVAGQRQLLPLLYEALTPSGLALARASGCGPEALAVRDLSTGIELQ
jgi:GNAT superfamily N-acetyltransferase